MNNTENKITEMAIETRAIAQVTISLMEGLKQKASIIQTLSENAEFSDAFKEALKAVEGLNDNQEPNS